MILVTGASGLVGSHLVKALVQQGEQVKALYRTNIPFELKGVEWVKGDILDVISLEEAFAGVDKVYHCAAIVSFNPKKKKLLHLTNVEGTTNVVNVCLSAGVDKLLFVSSVAALGRIREDKKINERMNWSEEISNSEYGKTKYLAEMEVWRGIGEGLKAVIVNPVIILGAADWENGSSGIFKSAYDEFPWYTNGVSGFVDVLDVVKAMIKLMNGTINEQRFILCAANVSYKEIFTEIALAFNKKPPHKKVNSFLSGIVWRMEAIKGKISGKEPLLTKETAKTAQARVYFDNSKLNTYLLNFEYRPIKESIKRICEELKVKYHL